MNSTSFAPRARTIDPGIAGATVSEGLNLLLLLGGIAWFWHMSRRAHETAQEVSRVVCDEMRVQRLDDSVVLRRLRIAWSAYGPTINHVYEFEFSDDGANRHAGEIALAGAGRLEWVRIQHPDGEYFVDIAAGPDN